MNQNARTDNEFTIHNEENLSHVRTLDETRSYTWFDLSADTHEKMETGRRTDGPIDDGDLQRHSPANKKKNLRACFCAEVMRESFILLSLFLAEYK